MPKFLQRLMRRGETGQSIIFLALGFVALVAFVGITTDVSLMFVRFSTLRRAVDSASIAAATQMRQGSDYATVRLAAQQFVDFHGLEDFAVSVDTCQSIDPGNPNQAELRTELCTPDQRKLVKVRAVGRLPTVFMRIIGINHFPIEVSAISETAALDVVLIMDVSESMLNETVLEDWARIGQGYVYVPPSVNQIINDEINSGAFVPDNSSLPPATEYWHEELLSQRQIEVNNRLWYTGVDHAETAPADGRQAYQVDVLLPARFTASGFPSTHDAPREACRVRFAPITVQYPLKNYGGYNSSPGDPATYTGTPPEVIGLRHPDDGGVDRGLYQELGITWSAGTRWDGFVPTFNFYGCCNDPTIDGLFDDDGNFVNASSTGADFNFSDLICQPFKGARDATLQFLDKIDFIRGDRVAFVNFDRSAFLINPYRDAERALGRSHMIDNKSDARQALLELVGVRAEPNFYVYDHSGSGTLASWDTYAAGLDPNGASVPIDYEDTTTNFDPLAADPLYFLYPIQGACPYHNGALGTNRSLYSASLGEIAYPYPADTADHPDWATFELFPGVPYNLSPEVSAAGSYELWASCRGTNMGAALREANNALLDPTTSRRFGAVWVIVMLSDGAAGASDPVRRNGNKIVPGNPYIQNLSNPSGYGQTGGYGAFGVCPIGDPNNPGEVVLGADDYGGSFRPPFCADEDPKTRHTCDFLPPQGFEAMKDNDYYTHAQAVTDGNDDGINGPATAEEEVEWNIQNGNFADIDLASCEDHYDVDDYARDWADFIALEEFNTSDALLPTIFTIGFGLKFDSGPSCTENVADCVGEQFLRYVADVGDNNRMDNDFYQDWLEGFALDGTVTEGFGSRGPCQDPLNTPTAGTYDTDGGGMSTGEIDYMYQQLPNGVTCGHYYNAPNADELELVFDAIASRMFTRLAG